MTRDGIDLIKALLVEQTPVLRVLFGLPSMRLIRLDFAIHVHLCHWGEPLVASYQMAAIYVAMVSLMAGKRPRTDTAVFGALSNAGYLTSRWEWGPKTFALCRFCGIRRVVLAADTKVRTAVHDSCCGGWRASD